jgi:pentalenene oxygenase
MEKAAVPPQKAAVVPVPTGAGALPVLGHIVPMLRDPLGLLASLPASGDLAQLRIGPLSRITVVCDPELTRQMLRADDVFDKGGPIFERVRELTGNGLANCPHAQHRRQRGLMQPAFHRDRFPGYAQAMAEEVSEVIGGWRDGQLIDVQSETMRLMVRVGMRTMFSAGLDPRLAAQATADLATAFRGIFLRTMLPEALSRLPTPGNRRYQTAVDRLRRAMDTIIAERRADPEDHGDLLYALLTARDPDSGDGMSDEEIVDQVLTFFAASAETSASTSAWALHEVGRNPAVAERLRAEVDAALGGEPPGLEDLPRLPLAGRIITETLRLYPPAWMLTRLAVSDTELGGYRIPAGTTIAYSAYLLHHNAGLFPDPERFDPGRWDDRHAAVPRGAFVPFGGGARKCIGDQFGLTLATLTLAAVTARWRLEPLPGHDPRPRPSLTLRPAGLRMRAAAR